MDDKRDDFDCQGGDRHHEAIVFRHSVGGSSSYDDLEEPLLQQDTGVSLDDSDIWSNIMMEETSSNDPEQAITPIMVARYDKMLKKSSQSNKGSVHSMNFDLLASEQKEALLGVSSRGTTNTQYNLSLWVKDEETVRFLDKSIDKLLKPKRKTIAFQCQDKELGAVTDKFSPTQITKGKTKEDFGLMYKASIEKFLEAKRKAFEDQCQEDEFGDLMDQFTLASSTGEKNKEGFGETCERRNQWHHFNENNVNGGELMTHECAKKPSREDIECMCTFETFSAAKDKTSDRRNVAHTPTIHGHKDERNQWTAFGAPSWTGRSTKMCPPRPESTRRFSLPPCDHWSNRHDTSDAGIAKNEWTPFAAPSWTERSCASPKKEAKRRLSLPSCEHRRAELARRKSLPFESDCVDQEVISYGKAGGTVRVTVTTAKDSQKTQKPSPALEPPTALEGTTTDYSKDIPLWNESIPDVISEKKNSHSVDYSSIDETNWVNKNSLPLATDEADFSPPTHEKIFANLSKIPLDDLTQITAWIEDEDKFGTVSDRCDAQDPASILAKWWDTVSTQNPSKVRNKPLDSSMLSSLLSFSTSDGGTRENSLSQSKSLESEPTPASDTRAIEQSHEAFSKSFEWKDSKNNKKHASNIVEAHEGVSGTLQNLLDLIASLELSQKDQSAATNPLIQEEFITGSMLDLMPQTTNLVQRTQEIGDEIWFQMEKLADESTRSPALVESDQHTNKDSDGAYESADLFDVFDLPACGDNLQHGGQDVVGGETNLEDSKKNAVIEESTVEQDAPAPTSESTQDQTHSESPRGNVRKVFPRMRRPFPPSRDRELPSNKRGSQVTPKPSSEDLYPKKLEQQSRAPVQVEHNVQQKSRWFSVRDLRRSFQRKRRDSKGGSENGAPDKLDSTPSSSTQTKKNVRFDDALVEIHEFEPEEEEAEEDDEIQTIFNYYFGHLAHEEHGQESYDEDELSDEHSAEGRNHCYIGYVPEPPIDCHGFDPKGFDADMFEDEESDSLEESI